MRRPHLSEVIDLPEDYQPIEFLNLEPRSIVLTVFYWITIPFTLLLATSYFLTIYDQMLKLQRRDLGLGMSIELAILLIFFVTGLLHILCHAIAILSIGARPKFFGRTKAANAKRLYRLQITLVQLVWTPYRAFTVLQFAWICLAPGIILTLGATGIMIIAQPFSKIVAWSLFSGIFYAVLVHPDLWLLLVASRHGPQTRIVDTEEGTILYFPENMISKRVSG